MRYSLWSDRDLVDTFDDEVAALRLARDLLADGFPLDELWLDLGERGPVIQGARLVESIRARFPAAHLPG